MKQETITIEQAKNGLIELICKFSNEHSDTVQILRNKCSQLEYGEIYRLLESSLNEQKDALERIRKESRRLAKRADTLAQCQLF